MRFLHRTSIKEGFVDLHNHTSYSWGREYGQIDLTPLGYLNECYEYTKKFNKPVSFSITDHNNTNGNIEVMEAIKNDPEKYKNINFIPGCEYTVSTDSLGQVYDQNGKPKPIINYNKLHMLAFGMDVNDPTIKYISELYCNDNNHLVEMSSEGAEPIDSSGYIEPVKYGNLVFCTKKWLKNHDMDADLSEFAKHCPIQDSFNGTKKVIEEFLINELKVPKNIMNEWNDFVSSPKNLRKYVKADIQEVMSAVEKAGGYTVLAHPLYCDPSKDLQNLNLNDPRNEKFRDISFSDVSINKLSPEQRAIQAEKYNKYYEYIYGQLTENAHNPVTGEKLNGLIGHELFHCANQKNAHKFEAMINAGNKYGMYCTGGSDSHGGYRHTVIPSRVVGPQVQGYDADCSKDKLAYALTRCKFVEDFMNALKTGEKLRRQPGMTANDQLTITKDNRGEVVHYSVDKFKEILFAAHSINFSKGKNKGKHKGKGGKRHLYKTEEEYTIESKTRQAKIEELKELKAQLMAIKAQQASYQNEQERPKTLTLTRKRRLENVKNNEDAMHF